MVLGFAFFRNDSSNGRVFANYVAWIKISQSCLNYFFLFKKVEKKNMNPDTISRSPKGIL